MNQLSILLLFLVAMPLAFGCASGGPVPAAPEAGEPAEVELRIVAINDFHGHIATSSDSFGGVGRADYLAANIAAARAGAQNSAFVSAGDLIGASPLISALFHDEPTIEAMNLIGLDFNGVGNHEFDEGPAELLRMQQGGHTPSTATWTAIPSTARTFSSSPPMSSTTTPETPSSHPTPSAITRGSGWRSLG